MNKSKKFYGVLAGLAIYGLSMSAAYALPIAGSTSAIFTNPTGGASMVTTGTGTSSFTWGSGQPSRLNFSGASFNTNTETYFNIGSINYFNGAINSNTGADAVDLSVTLNFVTPGSINQTFNYNLSLINTLNVGSPANQADIVAFPAGLPTETFVLGGVTYTVGLEVGVVTGSGFSNQTTFSVFERRSATATLRGIVTAATNAVPEPSILAILGIGMLGMVVTRRRLKA